MAYDVSLVECRSYDEGEVERALREAVEKVNGFAQIRSGMRVALKVNLVRGQKPEIASTVHHAVICALAKLIKELGAVPVIGDSPGGVFNAPYVRAIYEITGMRRAEAFGGVLNDDFSVTQVHSTNSKIAKDFPFTAWLQKADVIIDVCKLKTHGMMGMSNAVKNCFGVIPGTSKPEFHYRYPKADDFADMLVDLYEYCAPVLCICDAVIGMEGNGPTMGDPREIGCIMASRSGHAMDIVGAELIGMKPDGIPTLKKAIERKLVPGSVSKLEIWGDIDTFRVSDFKTLIAQSNVFFHILGDGFVGRTADFLAGRIFTPFPKLNKDECVGCAKCAGVCPAKAIKMQDGKPKIDRNRCIHCFCCQEFCPKGAMIVGKGLLLRLLG